MNDIFIKELNELLKKEDARSAKSYTVVEEARKSQDYETEKRSLAEWHIANGAAAAYETALDIIKKCY